MVSETLHQIRLHGAVPRHVAIIMDGNGRWARDKGLPRHAGHRAGMKSVRESVEGAIDAGVGILTLFAFSTENWQRPRPEVGALMGLLEVYARKERADLARQGVEVHVLGELDRIDPAARRALDALIEGTRGGSRLRLNLMISYGGREEIVRAARLLSEKVARGELDPDQIDDEAFQAELFTAELPDPDLLIRTSGEYRLSNFLLWQLAYTELHITSVLWPDFTREDLYGAVRDFQRRERRFGRVKAG
jgi:undecaprenyl diphosphate synthase